MFNLTFTNSLTTCIFPSQKDCLLTCGTSIKKLTGICKNVLAVTSLDATRNTCDGEWRGEKTASRSDYSGGLARLTRI